MRIRLAGESAPKLIVGFGSRPFGFKLNILRLRVFGFGGDSDGSFGAGSFGGSAGCANGGDLGFSVFFLRVVLAGAGAGAATAAFATNESGGGTNEALGYVPFFISVLIRLVAMGSITILLDPSTVYANNAYAPLGADERRGSLFRMAVNSTPFAILKISTGGNPLKMLSRKKLISCVIIAMVFLSPSIDHVFKCVF